MRLTNEAGFLCQGLERALLLGSERVDYTSLRRMLEDLPTQVRIAILDSCASGAFTRAKGGIVRPPFIVDTSIDVRGHAFLTSSSADEAAQVVNAVVTEYLRDKIRQRRLSKAISAEAVLRDQLAVYGEKHPKALRAAAELDAEHSALEAAMNSQNGDQYEVANDQSVKLAVPNHTPTSPKGFVIFGLAMLLALLAGIGFAIWRDRRETESTQTINYQPHPQ